MKIAVFWKKYNGTHHREIRHIFSFLFYAFSELGYDFDVFDQDSYQKSEKIKRAKRSKYLSPNMYGFRRLEAFTDKLPNMPFEATKIIPGYDKIVMFHTITNESNIINVKPGYFPGYFYFDLRGYSGWSDSNHIEKNEIKESEFDNLKNISKYHQKDFRIIDEYNNYIFVPLQVSLDSVANLAFYSQSDFIDKVVSIFKDKEYNVVFKIHPKEKNTYAHEKIKALQKYYNNIYLSDESVISLINKAKAVCVVNSGVGFESLINGLPVITFGESDYSKATFTYNEGVSSSEVMDFIEEFSDDDRKEVIKYSKNMISNNFIKIGDINAVKRVIEQ